MKILVCVKQIPLVESSLKITSDHKWIEEKNVSFAMNRFDEFALEEAVLIKEQLEEVTIDALSMGPARTTSVIRKALAKGADNGIHIVDENSGYTLPETRASAIAEFATQKSYDLIFTGVMAEDDMESQVGNLIASKLSMPSAVSVLEEKINIRENRITVKSEIENGILEEIELSLPAVITIQSGINHPRYPALSNVLRSKKQDIEIFHPAREKEKFSTIKLLKPEKTTSGTIIQGTMEEKAEKLIEILHSNSLL